MSIIKNIFVNSLLLLFLNTTLVHSEELKKIGKFKDWEAMVLNNNSEKVCFAQTKPVLQSPKGETREAVVGRCKIEKRPMLRIEAIIGTKKGEDRIETLLQNAETVKVATQKGPKAVTALEVGDEVLVCYEHAARHFGEAIDESIIEK